MCEKRRGLYTNFSKKVQTDINSQPEVLCVCLSRRQIVYLSDTSPHSQMFSSIILFGMITYPQLDLLNLIIFSACSYKIIVLLGMFF